MTKREKLFRSWQHLLRLDDIDIAFEEKKKFKVKTQMGDTRTGDRFQIAKVRVKKSLNSIEFERTVVHELLHVLFPSFIWEDGTALERELEVGVEKLARLLIKLRYRR